MLQINTSRFGQVQLTEEQVFCFPQGLVGFPGEQRLALLPVVGNPAFLWLQSLREEDLAFLLVDPFLFFAGYQAELSPQQERLLKVQDPQQVVACAVVTIPPGGVRNMTANLVAPVMLNLANRRGLQAVRDGTTYHTRHPLFTRTASQPAGAAGAGGY